MNIGTAFWVIMLIWLIFGVVTSYPFQGRGPILGFNLILFILITLLGWAAFGPPLHS